MKTPKRTALIILGVIILLYLIYAGIYIYRTSFIAFGERYFVLFDDAMISMRYAKNLVSGYGLVWNPGEQPVEGYTNPLWVIYMAIFHLLPIPTSKISLAIQLSGAIFLAINLYFVFQIAQKLAKNLVVPALATILTAFYMPLNNWSLQGMEVSLLVLMITSSAWLVLKNLDQNRFSIWPYIILGIGTLVRIDMAVPYIVVLGFLVLSDPGNRRKNLLWGLGLLLISLGGQTIFRLWYYGEPLPNTYYLKMIGFPLLIRLKRGGYVLFKLMEQMNWVLFLLPFTALLFRRDRLILILFAIMGGQVAYSVYVGGDAWEHIGGSNRYIALAAPIFFILFVYAFEQIISTIASRIHPKISPNHWLVNLTLIALVIASMINFNLLSNQRSLRRWILTRSPDFIEANIEYVEIANRLKEITTSDARIAVVSAGAVPYFTDLTAIDLLGKNDPYISRQPNHLPDDIGKVRPGHMKWDYDYAIGELKPDVVVQIWGDTATAKKYLSSHYVAAEYDGMIFSLLTNSPNIHWELVTIQP
jgi:hypothetical protein